MINIDEAIKKLEARKTCMEREASGTDKQCVYRECDECDLCYAQGTTGEQIESLEYAINNLKMKQWMIDEYKHEVDLLEQDLNDNSGCPTVTDVIVPSAKLGVYNRVLKDLKGDKEE